MSYTPDIRAVDKFISTFNRKHIPHFTPKKSDYYHWYNSFQPQIIEMYIIMYNIIKERHPKHKMNMKSNIVFNEFIEFIYKYSSKHVDKYLN